MHMSLGLRSMHSGLGLLDFDDARGSVDPEPGHGPPDHEPAPPMGPPPVFDPVPKLAMLSCQTNSNGLKTYSWNESNMGQ